MKLHHIGLLTKDIDSEAKHLRESCGYEMASGIIEDKIQTAKVAFLKQSGSDSYLELITPSGAASKLNNAMKKGVRLHHICYQSDDMQSDLENYRKNGFFVICQPVCRGVSGKKNRLGYGRGQKPF